MVVLTTKSNHKNIAWYEHIWHLCGSYQLLIHITKSTRPFAFPIYQHDNTISNISPRTRFYLPTDQDSGYWQIFLEITSCSKLPSCTNNYSWHLCFYNCCWQHTIVCRRPRHNKLTLNVPLTYYYLLRKIALLHQQLFMTPMFLKMLLTAYYCMPDTLLAKILLPPVQNLPSCTNIYSGHLCFKSCCWQNTIVCKRPDTLLAYLECAFEMLLQYQAHVKLKKCKFLHPILECVGVELTSNGNKPTRSKLPAFFKK